MASFEDQTDDIRADIDRHKQLRRCLLLTLYRQFRRFPYAPMELSDLALNCPAEPAALNWNLIYLEKCGFVELATAVADPTYLAASAAISAAGIDLVEDIDRFDLRFPQVDTERS